MAEKLHNTTANARVRSLSLLSKILGYNFSNPALLDMALTHSSWANEHNCQKHNERIEFLGDAVLQLCVSAALYKYFPNLREGDLTKIRSKLVNTSILAKISRMSGLNEMILLGRGEEKQGGRNRDSLLADALEAVLGAIYLDGGFEAASTSAAILFSDIWPEYMQATLSDGQKNVEKTNYKTLLQEETQKRLKSLPVYKLIDSTGSDHEKKFTVCLELSDGNTFIASDSRIKYAEHKAARLALDALQNK